MTSKTTLICDLGEWRLGEGGELEWRSLEFSNYNDWQGWQPADRHHALAVAIKSALTSISVVKELIEQASTDRLKGTYRSRKAVQHQLIGNTVTTEKDGVHAKCTCGWDSGRKFTSMSASVAFSEHKENSK
jgi:hypothetical protein